MEFGPQGGRPSRAQDMCSRFCPAPLGIVLWFDKLEFFEFPVIASQCSHWRGNLPDRSTISQSFTGRFRIIVQKNSLYDDGLPEIRWRFPHQSEDWFGMTGSDGPLNSNLQYHRTIPSGSGKERLRNHVRHGLGPGTARPANSNFPRWCVNLAIFNHF